MNILIVEDEHLAARDLETLIHRHAPGARIVAVLPSVAATTQWLATNELPDLILSDIQLADGVSFEIFEKNNVKCPIIFTTAYDEYAIRAFKLNSIDYLLKPIDGEELSSAIQKYKAFAAATVFSEQLRSLVTTWDQDKKYKERFLTVHRNALVPIAIDEIAFFQKDELIYLVTSSNQRLLSDHQTMDEIESLVDPKIFFRVNRQFIVHISTVEKLRPTHKGANVHLKAPFSLELEMSREKVSAFKSWLSR